MKQFLILLSLLLFWNLAESQDWQWLNPKPQVSTLNSIIFTDPNTGFAVGNSGAIVKTTNGGDTWSAIEPVSDYNLLSVDFPDPVEGFAVGLYSKDKQRRRQLVGSFHRHS